MAFWEGILGALWLFLPAFVANMSPVLTARLVPRWKAPLDFGASTQDGRRLLGDGKTWRGLVLGAVAAGATATLQARFPMGIFTELDFGRSAGATLWAVFLFGFTMGASALLGDAIESYAKRRRGKERGASWFPFDQLDFVVFGLIGVFMWHPLLPQGWVWEHFGTLWVLGTLLVGTPLLHLIVNRIGYWLKLKDVPW